MAPINHRLSLKRKVNAVTNEEQQQPSTSSGSNLRDIHESITMPVDVQAERSETKDDDYEESSGSDSESEKDFDSGSDSVSSESDDDEEPVPKKTKEVDEEDGEASSSVCRQVSREIYDGKNLKVLPNKDRLLARLEENYKKCFIADGKTIDDEDSGVKKNGRWKYECPVVDCRLVAHHNGYCRRHDFYVKEVRELCSGKEKKEDDDDWQSNIDPKKKEALLKINSKLSENPNRGVYVGLSQNVQKRLGTHKRSRNFSSSEILLNCKNAKQAGVLEFEILCDLSKADRKRVVNTDPGGTIGRPLGTKNYKIYALFFDDFVKPDMKVRAVDFESREYINALTSYTYKKSSYDDCAVKQINMHLPHRRVIRLLGLKRKDARKKGKGIKVACPEPDCGSIMTRKHLARHLVQSHSEQVFKCQTCDKTYKCEKSLLRHCKKKHSLEKTHYEELRELDMKIDLKTCPECKKTYGKSHTLQSHLQQHRLADFPGKLMCEVCSRIYISNVGFHFHQVKCKKQH